MNTLLQATFPRLVRSLEVTNQNILQSMRASLFDIIQGHAVAPFEGDFHFGEEEKVCWRKVGAVELLRCHFLSSARSARSRWDRVTLSNAFLPFELAHPFLKTSTPGVILPQTKPAGACGVKRYQGRRPHYRLQSVGVSSGVQDKTILIT
ncbi:hypothetical protein TNCV_4335061 [Trichonephila clavipes]|uniref:Uncharacterized protein n=1 Tax=Trichonephila clavipes TaxID=2585209 RepID=A0A8X6RDE4_TRICX|nr:hypothetical protein TNCV_4335061 [Trichonephila clavipes]